MNHHLISRLAAVLAAAGLCAAVPASAADSGMKLRMTASQQYITESELKSGDVLLDGALHIENYTGFSNLRLHLVSDPELVIENLDFARDASRKESDGADKQSYFVTHGETKVTGLNDQGEAVNVCLWYGPGQVEPAAGVVEDPDSPFLTYRLRVPQGTAAGIYTADVSKSVKTNVVGQLEYDFQAYLGTERLDIPCEGLKVVVEPDPVRGDVDGNGKIEPWDATAVLRFCALTNAGFDLSDPELTEELERVSGTSYIHMAMKAGDIDLNGKIEPSDATAILVYANLQMIGFDPDWDEL